jgi:hypothetical protein
VKKHKFLSIHRETLRQLSPEWLTPVAGGVRRPEFTDVTVGVPDDAPRSAFQADCNLTYGNCPENK